MSNVSPALRNIMDISVEEESGRATFCIGDECFTPELREKCKSQARIQEARAIFNGPSGKSAGALKLDDAVRRHKSGRIAGSFHAGNGNLR